MRQIIWILFVVMMSVTLSLADVIILKDGTRLEGDVKKTPGGWSVTLADGKVIDVPAEKVKSMELGQSPTKGSPAHAQSNLLSLRRSVENVADINQVIERYNRFIEQNKDTPAAAEAQKDLLVWQDRLDRGLVKLGNKWVTAQERTEQANQALAITEQARDFIAHGRHHDGNALINQALEADPLCAPALYLRGVVQYQDNKLAAARKSFEAVIGQLHDHAPSLNNMAVILWRQNAVMPALSNYDKSITAAPVNKFILDNVAEALAAVPDDQRKNKVAQALFRKFTEQDTRLQEALAAEGLYRWGTAWIDKEAMQRLRDQEKEINDQMAAVRTSVQGDQQRLRQIDAQIVSIQASLRQIADNSVMRNGEGRLIRVPYPPAYYELQSEEARLQAERAGLVTKLQQADTELRRLQAQMPAPKFSGIQRLVGVEGMPVMVLDPSMLPAPVPTLPVPTLPPSTAPAKE